MRSRAYRTLFAGQVVSLLGDGFALLAIPLLVLHTTHSPVWAALVGAPRALGYLLVGLPAGAVVDRFDPRACMIVADAARAALFFVLAAGAGAGWDGPAIVLLLATVAAAFSVVFDTAFTVMMREMVAEADLLRANAQYEAANQIAILAGPGIVGAVIAAGGIGVAVAANGASFVVSLLSVLVAGLPRLARASRVGLARMREWLLEIREGIAVVARRGPLRTITVVHAGVNATFAAENLVLFYGKDMLHLSSSTLGLILVANGGGGAAAALAAGWLGNRVGEWRLMLSSLVALGASVVVLAACRSWITLAVDEAAVGVFALLVTVCVRAMRQRLAPPEALGRVTSVGRTASVAMGPLGAAVAGLGSGLAGGDPRLVFVGAGLAMSALVFLPLLDQRSGVAPAPVAPEIVETGG